MSRRTVIAAAIAVLAALLFVGSASAATRPRRVVVVLAPYMTWDDVLSGAMPQTRALAEDGVVGAMNVRSGTVGAGAPTLARGALMFSAGASTLSDIKALEGYDSAEVVGSTPAAGLYRLLFARSPGDARVLYLGSPRQAIANSRTSSNALIGALGQAMRDGGLLTAAVGNSDPGLDILELEHSRPAAIAAADVNGLIDLGQVSASLLASDAASPYGVRTDQPALESAYAGAASAGARFIVVDPGDLARAYALSSSTTSEAAAATKVGALRSTDNVVGMVARTMTRDDLLVVLAPAVPEVKDQPPGFAPVILSGALDPAAPARAGLVNAPSTRRVGVCTIMDVTATLVDAAGVGSAPEMIGSPIRGTGDASLAERVTLLGRLNSTALSVEGIRTSTLNIYITLTIIMLLVAAAFVGERGRMLPQRARGLTRALLMLSLAFAPAGLLMFTIVRWPSSPVVAAVTLVGTAVLIWAITLYATRGRRLGVAMLSMTALTTAVLVVDQWLGAPLSYAGIFGYSPLFGARYYGIGNEMAGALLGSSMVSGALVLDLFRDRPWASMARRVGWPVLGAVIVVTTAAPFLGANIGAVAWMTVGFLVSGLVLAGKRVLTWRNAAIAVALVLMLLVAATAIDVLGGAGGTHLGRAASGTGQNGADVLLSIVSRKAETNMRIFGRTNWTWLLLAVLVVLGYMRWRPKGEFAVTLARYPALAAAMAGSLAAGLVGYFTEDSGIIIPALALLPIGVAVLDVMLASTEANGGESG